MNRPSTFTEHLTTPIIITNEMDESDFRFELAQARLRSIATADFVSGSIDSETFIEVLDACGVNVDTAVRDWSLGLSYVA